MFLWLFNKKRDRARRPGRCGAERLKSSRGRLPALAVAAKPAKDALAVVPGNQQRRGDEDGGVGAAEQADQHGGDELADGDAAEEDARRSSQTWR